MAFFFAGILKSNVLRLMSNVSFFKINAAAFS
ncbi:hypothetical protein Aconfl_35700 [Algoriphagus confluentis]|uniref:Uncharacterized protein n=1 Tax=Algoriphagus confluentis TaxID=1697556 RepID=A0ABQ6PTL9_9BACT|nr:hypothetical protein Aconfl_35700 [Algoriphagus confluentis]